MGRKKEIYRFKISLKDVKPPIWRRIEVPGTYTFWDLHVAIQDAMGWLDYHLHEFLVKDLDGRQISFGIPDEDWDSDILPGWKHKVSKFVSLARPKFQYVYDFGDDWRHSVELEAVDLAEPGVSYPRCIKGKRACPPEDCGGAWGYQELLEVLSDPKHPEYSQNKSWVESMKQGPFRPDDFDPTGVHFDDPQERYKVAFCWGPGETEEEKENP